MKHGAALAMILVVLFAAVPATHAQDECTELPAGTATINGSVKSAVNDQAVFATVTATAEIPGYGSKRVDAVTSFLDGTFSLQVPAPATYVVTAAPFDQIHAPEFYDGVLSKSAATTFAVSDGQTVNGVDFTVIVGSTISGTVTAQQGGAPIENVAVQAIAVGDLFAYGVGQTDAAGEYTIGGLALQDYQVVFYPEESPDDYLVEVYNEKSGFPGDPVTVTQPGVTGIDGTLERGGRIEGKVTGPGGQPVLAAGVASLPSSGAYTFGGDATDSNGDYSLLVPAGDHRVFVIANAGMISEYYDDAADLASADAVQVTAQQTTSNIDLMLAASGHITGRVTDAITDLGIQNARVVAYTTDGVEVTSTRTDVAGNYNLQTNLRTGQYKVGFQGPERELDGSPGYVDVYYSNKSTLGAANAVSVSAGNTTAGIDQVLVPCDQIGTTTTTTGEPTTTTTLGGGEVCGDPVALTVGRSRTELPHSVTATDGLFVLRASVGLVTCADCVCNVNGAGGVTATDALYVLQIAVGQSLPLLCPPC